jgi:hypothetical protein
MATLHIESGVAYNGGEGGALGKLASSAVAAGFDA